jgi:hypothetical protein
MAVLPNARSIEYELQSSVDPSEIADMSCFSGGTVTLQREDPFSDRFSAVISDIPATECPSHGVPNFTDLRISNVGNFPQLKTKRCAPRLIHTVTVAGLEPTQGVPRIEPSGMETFFRDGDHFEKSWSIGQFKAKVISATYTKGTEEKAMTAFDDPAWQDLTVDICTKVKVTVGDVVSYTNDQPGTDYSHIVEMQRMVEGLVD